ncbi:hypothetical protein NY78_4280 [Desulfovibrio sp. TomC]|nr:hypothetical protein NY78_4280 [Desulfovibrio sp. TomC]
MLEFIRFAYNKRTLLNLIDYFWSVFRHVYSCLNHAVDAVTIQAMLFHANKSSYLPS